MSITGTFFSSPNGDPFSIEITSILIEDEKWFKAAGAKISMEQLMNGQNVVYADVGVKDEEGTPIEGIEISFGRTCEECFTALRKQCEELLEKGDY